MTRFGFIPAANGFAPHRPITVGSPAGIRLEGGSFRLEFAFELSP
ncbi:hypothetical protein SAMN05216332_11010 [Nitrosospira briensis]|nr:hypothetical protein SAMN05216332_11010 [Nitrosospira briensis]